MEGELQWAISEEILKLLANYIMFLFVLNTKGLNCAKRVVVVIRRLHDLCRLLMMLLSIHSIYWVLKEAKVVR